MIAGRTLDLAPRAPDVLVDSKDSCAAAEEVAPKHLGAAADLKIAYEQFSRWAK